MEDKLKLVVGGELIKYMHNKKKERNYESLVIKKISFEFTLALVKEQKIFFDGRIIVRSKLQNIFW